MDATDFSVKDYELKIRYLTDHLSRMWNRFNYMLSIQTAIAGGKFFLNTETTESVSFGIMGLLFAIIWYALGAQDRYLFVLYRNQVAQSFKRISADIALKNMSYVGKVEDAVEGLNIEQNPITWRSEKISSTKMAAIVPIVIIISWIVYMLFSYSSKSQ